jgi:hypothetical protein
MFSGGALTTKRIAEFSKKVQDVFNLMSISRKYKIVGSGALQDIKYIADYDLNEVFKDEISDKKSLLDEIYKVFRTKFIQAKTDPNLYITDFKCGEDSDGEPLRWSYEDIIRSYKRLADGRIIHFKDCILMKATMKLDIIAYIDGYLVEFSDNYFLKLGDDANFFPHDVQTDHILNSLKHDYAFNMQSADNPFKALKRAFSYWRLKGEGKNEDKIDRLTDFFNSETGLLYKLRSNLGTIETLLDQDFKKPKMEQIRTNLGRILELLRGQPSARKLIETAMEKKTASEIKPYLEKAKEILQSYINTSTKEFVSKNKNLLIF